MSRSLEMVFDAKVRNAGDVEKLEATINRFAQAQQLGTGNVRLFNSMLSETAQRSGGYAEALRIMSGGNQIFSELSKAVLGSLKEQNKAAADAANAAKKAAADFEKAKQSEARAAQQAADAIIAQHERVQKAIGRIGTQIGATALGRSIGVPGIGRGAGSLLSAFGVSGGAALGIGAAATGVFAAVEFAKSIDQLTKWAQEQKNAAQETGITVSEMQELERVSERTGVSLSGTAKSVQDLSKEMIEGRGRSREIQSALSELGLKSSTAFEEPYRALTDIQKGLAGIKDPVERDRIAIELLGEAAGRAAAATADAAKSGNIIDPATIATLDHARQTMVEIGEQWDVLKSLFAKPLLGTLQITRSIIGNAMELLDEGSDKGSMGATLRRDQARDADDEAAEAKSTRVKQWTSANAIYGTPEDKFAAIESQIATAKTELQDKFAAGKILQPDMLQQLHGLESQKAAAEAARKSAEEYRDQVATFRRDVAAPMDSADTLRQLTELPKRYSLLGSYAPYQDWMRQLINHAPGAFQQIGRDQLERQYPGVITGDYQKLYSPMTRQNAEFQGDLERQERAARESQEQLKRESAQRIEDIEHRRRDQTEDNDAALRLESARMTGQRGFLIRQNQLGSTGAAQLDLEDQMKLIGEAFAAKANPVSASIASLRQVVPITDEQKSDIDRKIGDAQAELQKLQNDRLTQSTEALGKFNESVEEASNKLRDEFGSFAEGLFSAGLKGHAGTYSRNFLLGQADKMVGNVAKSVYQPGMLSIPGQGDADDPTFLGKILQGTMFAQDPKAQASAATIDNTSATTANTTATLALCAALGVDPNSLGIAGASSVSIPFFGSGSTASSPLLDQVQGLAKGLGITLPGVTSHGRGASSSASANPAISAILKLFGIGNSGPSASSQPGWGTGAGIFPPFPYGGDDSSGWSFLTAGQDPTFGGGTSDSGISFPALGISSSDIGSMAIPGASSAPAFQSQMTDTIGSAFDSALSGESTPTSGGLTAQVSKAVGSALSNGARSVGGGTGSANPTPLGMGFQAASGAFGMYQGITEMTHGGAQNITGGLGSTLMGAAGILAMIPGAQIAAPFVAAAGAVSSLISAFMGDPRANRAKQLTEQEIAQTYTAPTPLNVNTNANGMMTTTDYRGKVESLDALPTASKVNTLLGFDPYNPSHVLSSSGWSLDPSGMVPAASHAMPVNTAPPITVHVSTFDSKSFMDHGQQFADALIPVLQSPHRIGAEIQRVVNP